MADNDLKPMTDGDIATPSGDPDFQPAAPLKNTGLKNAGTTDEGGTVESRAESAKQAIRDNGGKVVQQATDKLRLYADDGKAKAGSALDQLSQLLIDAAAQVDEKLGAQYGEYARTAATQVQGFADTVKAKDMDELLEDARGFVRASPAVAIGAAAAVGFVVARLFQSGLDDRA